MALPRFCSHCAAPLPAPPPVTCPACDTSHWLDAKPCAGALVSRGGKLLLVRRAHEPWKGAWDVPGGFCSGREHPQHAAVREVREETGLEVALGEVLGMWIDCYASEGPGAEKITLNIYFHATVVGSTLLRPGRAEAAEIGWFAADELPEPLAFPGHLPEALAAWRAGLDEAPRPAATRHRTREARKPEPFV
jgi:ADP-ribose pyrophosphatase YjhB (NUDIX family)